MTTMYQSPTTIKYICIKYANMYIFPVQNLSDLVAKQQKAKYYQQSKDGKYTRLCKTDTALDNEHGKQEDRLQTIHAIMDRLSQEYPHIQPALRKVGLAYGSRGHVED